MPDESGPGPRIVSMQAGQLWYMSEDGVAHDLCGPEWTPDRLGYVDRCTLEARLMALAAIVDPGTYDEYLMNEQNKTLTRSILSSNQNGDVT